MRVIRFSDATTDKDARQSGGYLTVEGAAEHLGVSAATIWRRLRAGALPRERIMGRAVIPITALARPDMAKLLAGVRSQEDENQTTAERHPGQGGRDSRHQHR